MRESVFQSEITASCHELLPDWHYYKIPDQRNKVSIKRPYDCYLLGKTHFIAMELKQHRTISAWAFNEVKVHQVDALKRVNSLCQTAGILLNIRNKVTNNAIWMSIGCYIWFRDDVYIDRKSMPLRDIIDNPDYGLNLIKLDRIKLPSDRYGWDMRTFVKQLYGKELSDGQSNG